MARVLEAADLVISGLIWSHATEGQCWVRNQDVRARKQSRPSDIRVFLYSIHSLISGPRVLHLSLSTITLCKTEQAKTCQEKELLKF